MGENRLAIKTGVTVSLGILLGLGACRLVNLRQVSYDFLRNGETVYTGAGTSGHDRVRTTDTLVNVHQKVTQTAQQVGKELPQAIRRYDDEGNPFFVVPQIENGRVLVAEYPERSIRVRPGRLVLKGSRLVVSNETADDWSHVEIKDFRQPSAVESAVSWLGSRLGI